MLASVYPGNRLRVWLVTGCCLTFTLLFLASFNGELGLPAQKPGNYSFNVQDGPFESKHDLLEDVANATLGVSYGFSLTIAAAQD
jgi:hypothetical protein